jgi:hypothetical protein
MQNRAALRGGFAPRIAPSNRQGQVPTDTPWRAFASDTKDPTPRSEGHGRSFGAASYDIGMALSVNVELSVAITQRPVLPSPALIMMLASHQPPHP